MVAVLGLVSALVYGVSDFLGGISSRRLSPLLAVALTFVVAAACAAIAVAIEQPVWSARDFLLGLVAGVAGGIGTWAFYAVLAIGPMSVLSPAVAVLYAVIPAIVGISLGERLPVVGYLALVAVAIAAVLLGVSPQRDGRRITPRALLLALVAGLGFAGYIIAIDFTAPESGLVPLLGDYLSGTVIILAALSVRIARRGRAAELAGLGRNRATGFAIIAGALLAVANILLVVGLHLGDLAVMGVLNSLYPLSTVVLALWLLHERLSVPQWIGIALGLGGAAALAVV